MKRIVPAPWKAPLPVHFPALMVNSTLAKVVRDERTTR